MKKVFGLPRRTPTVFVLRHAKLYSLESRNNLRLLFLFSAVFISLQVLFFPQCSPSSRLLLAPRGAPEGNHSLHFLCPLLPLYRYGMFSISFLGADRWNSLPVSCRQVEHLSVFVLLWKEHLGFPVTRRQRL